MTASVVEKDMEQGHHHCQLREDHFLHPLDSPILSGNKKECFINKINKLH